jgi:hypothetical protein
VASIPHEWTEPDWLTLAYVEDTLTGYLGIVESRPVSVSGLVVQVSGVSGVITRPESRRSGVATAMLGRAAAFIRQDVAAEFCLLFCSEEIAALYSRLGWKCVEGPTTFQQTPGTIDQRTVTMVLSCRGKEWPAGPIHVCGPPW